MRVLTTPAELRHQADAARLRGERVALVPILGGMHDGQAALLRSAGAQCDLVVAVSSLPAESFDGMRVDLLWRPPLPTQPMLDVQLASLQPWHVAAVGDTLRRQASAIVAAASGLQPARVYLSTTHAPTAHVVERLLAELLRDDIEVRLVPALRDGSGLVVSTALEQLESTIRDHARAFPRALDSIEAALVGGEASLARLRARGTALLAGDRNLDLRYLEFVDPASFRPLGERTRAGTRLLLVAGVSISGVQLIDVRPVQRGAAAAPADPQSLSQAVAVTGAST